MKRILIIFLLSLITVSAVFAGGSKEAEDAKKYTVRVALVSNDSHLHNMTIAEWAEDAMEKTNGRLILKVMGSSQLGGERDYLEGMQLGNIEMSQVSSGPVSGFVKDFSILSLPYFFKDYDEMETVFDGVIGEKLFNDLDEIGIVGLTWFTNGFRNVYTKNKAVYTPRDLRGLKIRVMESRVMVETLNAMGASATPMAYGELYAAIQQGILDGAENALGNIYSDKYYEICKNVSLTGHFAPPGVVAISKKSFEKLPKDIQDYLLSSAKEFGLKQRIADFALQKEMEQLLIDKGMQVNEVDQDSFVEATKSVYVLMKDELSDEIKNLAIKELGKEF